MKKNNTIYGMSLAGWIILSLWLTLTLCPLVLAMSENTPSEAARWMIAAGIVFGAAGHLLGIPQTAAEAIREKGGAGH